MNRRLTIIDRHAVDAGGAVLDALAEALLPRLVSRLAAMRQDADLVDVAAVVPLPRRTVYRACRAGSIEGARRVGRRWLATRAAIDAWVRSCGPRVVPSRDADDDLEPLRRSLAKGIR
ncbi:MAG: helix-turn-helix domain-containing protein [Polyangiaceae bacterium]